MILISNTGPLIALAKISQLTLLASLPFKRICIPSFVHRELFGKIGPETDHIDSALDSFIEVGQCSANPDLVSSTAHLDRGEQEVILLGADQTEDVTLLLDDQAGRRMANNLNLLTTGTVGILLFAKQQGIIPAVIPLVENIRENGYWLSDALITHTRNLASE